MSDAEKLREYADACFASCYPPVDAVVQAILAERARCAKVADEYDTGWTRFGPNIADAIRRGTP